MLKFYYISTNLRSHLLGNERWLRLLNETKKNFNMKLNLVVYFEFGDSRRCLYVRFSIFIIRIQSKVCFCSVTRKIFVSAGGERGAPHTPSLHYEIYLLS